jgi:multiple sugar transport system substrate-binding protein
MTIQMIGPDDPALAAARKAIAAHPEWDLDLKVTPWADYRDVLMESLHAEQALNQAVFVPGHVWIPELAAAGLIADLEPLIASLPRSRWQEYDWEDIIASVQRDSSYQDRRFMIPYFNDAHILFYRGDLLDLDLADPLPELSPLDLLALAAKAHNPPEIYGIALKAHPSEIFFDWLPYFYAAGGKIADANLRPTFFSDAGIRALEIYCQLREYAPPDTHTFGNEQIAEVLRRGTAALVTTWGGQAAPIFLDSGNPFRGLYQAAVFPYPCGGTWGFALPANQSPEAQIKALEHLLVLNSVGMDQDVLIAAGSPIRSSSYTDKAFQEYSWLRAQYEILQRIVFLPFDPRIGIYLGHLTDALTSAFLDEKSPRESLQEANYLILAALEGSD